MTPEDAQKGQAILGKYAAGDVTWQEAFDGLRALGVPGVEAREALFVAGGASDVVGVEPPEEDIDAE